MSTFESQTGKLAPQSMLNQQYMILRLAGRGGMSAIYQALDMKRGRQRVAIKEMSLENLDEMERQEALTRFQQEAHLLGTLNHPNLPRIYDAFGENGRSFLVMDYIDGKTLLQLLQDAQKPLPVDQVMHYADQLCDVLAYLHQQHPPIIFRDLKPTNVMATQDGHVYLIDFGIARFFKEGQPQDTTVLGSPGYAPPEQHGSGQTNPRSDLYALGATLHCCLTNRDPYHAADRFSFAPVRQFNSQVPGALDQLIARMVSLDENQRPASAMEVKQALAHIRQQTANQGNDRGRAEVPSLATSSSPTQYVKPAAPAYQPTQPALARGAPQEKLILRATPASNTNASPGYPSAPYSALPPVAPQYRRPAPSSTYVWTPGFIVVFLLLLVLSVSSSVLAFNISHPYGPTNNAGLDHATEAALAVLALLISFTFVVMARSSMAVLIILGNVATILVAGFAFLLQTLRDIQPSAQIFTQAPVNDLLSYGLLASGIISLLWLFRPPFTWSDRFWLILFFGTVCLCAFAQSQYLDTDVAHHVSLFGSLIDNATIKHLLLLSGLIVLIQGILAAGQMERKRKRI